MAKDTRRSSAAWQRARAECLARSNICWLCGEPIDMALRNPHPYSATVDHVIPLNDGGSLLDQANLRPAHRRCNIQRENRRRKGADYGPAILPSRSW